MNLKVIYLIFTILILSQCSNKSKSEIIVLETNFSGHVVVFYSQKTEKGETLTEAENIIIKVPSDGIIFTKQIYDSRIETVIHQNGIDKPVSGHAGSIFIPNKVDFACFYIGDSLELKGVKYLNYKELKTIYLDNVRN